MTCAPNEPRLYIHLPFCFGTLPTPSCRNTKDALGYAVANVESSRESKIMQTSRIEMGVYSKIIVIHREVKSRNRKLFEKVT